MLLGIVQRDALHDTAWFAPYWAVLTRWADRLVSALPFPANQICTDDFTGALPNNTVREAS